MPDEEGRPEAAANEAPDLLARRLLWFEVEELPAGALRVRRVEAPRGSGFMWVWLVGWFGGTGCMGCMSVPLLALLPFWLLGAFAFWCFAGSLGIGNEVWEVERDLLVVNRNVLGRPREVRFTGAALQLGEERGLDSHTLSLTVHRGEEGEQLFHMNYPSPEQRTEAEELARRLVQTTGWRLVIL